MPSAVQFGNLRRAASRLAARLGTMAVILLCPPSAHAQNIISVPFTSGFIGSSPQSINGSNSVLTYQTLQIARTFFIQSSSVSIFQVQGNDIPGTLRIVRTDGTAIDIPASATWRNNGGTTNLIGILPRPVSPITLTYSGGSINITNGSVPGGTSVGGYIAGFGGTPVGDNGSASGNAGNGMIDDLNAYLATVVASRPAGPVTVTSINTSSTTPTITGTATIQAGQTLSVVVGGIQYTNATTPSVVAGSGTWSLALTAPLTQGTYSVTATLTDASGFTLSDATINELVIGPPLTTLTIGGSFSATAKTYDGTTTVAANASGLSLIGVTPPDQVTIASVTFAFQSAAAGTSRSAVITAITLGGANAALYTASLAGAPTASADITPRALSMTGVTATSRSYDGTTVMSLGGTPAYANLAPGDVHAVTGTGAASVTTADVGTAKAVTVTGFLAPNANYSLSQPSGLTASITPRGLTLGGSFSASPKPYDATTAATVDMTGLTLNNVIPGDTVALASVTAVFASASVAVAAPVSITAAGFSGSSAGNYAFTITGAPTASADITRRTLTVGGAFVAADKVADGSTTATVPSHTLLLVGAISNDAVSVGAVTAVFNDALVGVAKPVTLATLTLGGASASNYIVQLTGAPATTASITSIVAVIPPMPPSTAPPTAPRSVTGTAGDGSVTISWIAPLTDGCSAVTSYVAQVSQDDGLSWSPLIIPVPETSATFTGLGNNRPTRVRVAAVNGCATGDFESASSVVPVGVTRLQGGTPSVSAPGTAGSTVNGVTQPVAATVVNDSVIVVSPAPNVALRLRTEDSSGVAIEVDSTGILSYEHGGRAGTSGTGFKANTVVTVYAYANGAPGQPQLLARLTVAADGTFDTTTLVPAGLLPGFYTLQVNGIDKDDTARSVAVGIEVTDPPAELVLRSEADRPTPAVGDSIVITLTVTNEGPGPALDVLIPRAFNEPGFRIVATLPLEGTYDEPTQAWRIPRIDPAGRARMRITAIVLAPTATPVITP